MGTKDNFMREQENKEPPYTTLIVCFCEIYVYPIPGGGGVHDLRMDEGLPPGFQKGTLF